MIQTIYLASRSPRRVELLKQIGVECLIKPADIDESVLAGELPKDYVLRLAREKAISCQKILGKEYLNMPILAADTTVALDDMILGKPINDADAFSMLKSFSGRQHEVHTAIAVVFNQEIQVSLSSTLVEMMALTDAMIHDFIAMGEHIDKAGSYGIQGLAGAWIKNIEGSYSGVMGLPVYETAQILRNLSVKKLSIKKIKH